MKKILFFLLVSLAAISCNKHKSSSSANVPSGDSAFMYFKEDTHDLGKVKQGELVASTFIVENKGKTALLISAVNTSCGCTVAKFEDKPIPTGKTGTIELILNTTGKHGKVRKTATVVSNASPKTKELTLRCEVELPNNN